MAYQLFTVRTTIGETTTEYTGTLADIVQWAQKNQDAPFNRRIMGVGWEWFTDRARGINPQDLSKEEATETYPLSRPAPGGGKFFPHIHPLPVTRANVENYVRYITAEESDGEPWSVEMTAEPAAAGSDQVYRVQAFANGDKARQWTGTLPELVEKLEEWGLCRFCTPEEMFSHDEGRNMTAWKWFTDKPGMCHNEAGEHPEDMREFEPLDNPFPVWRHVQPLAVTTENVRLFAERIVRWENPTYDWRVELEPVE